MGITNNYIFKYVFNKVFTIPLFILDRYYSKDKDLWIFPVGMNKQWGGNLKAFFDSVKCLDGIKPVILINNAQVQGMDDEAKNYTVPVKSVSGLKCLLRSSVIILQYHRTDFFWPGITNHNRIIYNLWHGISLKGIGFTSVNSYTKRDLKYLDDETNHYTSVVASSEIDRMSMASSFKIPLENVSIVGLPRNDWLINGFSDDLEKMRLKLLNELDGRRLILYAPTFRGNHSGVYDFTFDQIKELDLFLESNGYVLGIRGHINRIAEFNYPGNNFVDLNSSRYPECHVLLDVADVLITDYSSVWVDYILTDKPVIGFCYDWDEYMQDRGLLYSYEHVFPGPISYNFIELMKSLDDIVRFRVAPEDDFKYKSSKSMFHKYLDGNSSKRIVSEILEFQRHLS